MTDRNAAASVKPAKKRDLLRWAVWPLLGVAVLVGAFEIAAKRRAEGTSRAWRAALEGTAETAAFRRSDLAAHVSGSPAVTEAAPPAAARAADPLVDKTLVYAWRGVFRTYAVSVHLSRGENPEVEAIDGP